MKLLLTIAFIITLQSSFGQDSIQVRREYRNAKPTTKPDSIFYEIPNTIFISLDEGFDDSLYVTVNDVPVIQKYLKTNQSIGYAGGLQIYFKDSSEVKILKLQFVKANRYIQEKVNLNYTSLEIRGLNPWLLIYSNHFYTRE